MQLPFHPVLLLGGVTLFGALACLMCIPMAGSRWKRILFSILAPVLLVPSVLLVLALKPEWVDGRLRTFKGLFAEIEPGMTRAEVKALIEQRYPAGGVRRSPRVTVDAPEDLCILMDPEGDREPNCEGIILKFGNDRVVQKQYSPD